MMKKNPIESRLKPPKELKSVAEKKEFSALLTAYSGDFFNEGDLPLLINYVRMKMSADRTYKEYSVKGEVVEDAKGNMVMSPYFNAHAKACASMAILAQKLRLAPSARMRQEAPTQSVGKSTSNRGFDPGSDWRDHKNK